MARQAKPAEPQPGDELPPPYFIATQALFTEAFGRAFNPGDRVPADHVARFGWADKVRHPDAPQPPTPNEPETADGQASTDTKGDA